MNDGVGGGVGWRETGDGFGYVRQRRLRAPKAWLGWRHLGLRLGDPDSVAVATVAKVEIRRNKEDDKGSRDKDWM